MFQKIFKLLKSPCEYLPLAIRKLQLPLCSLFKNSAFYLQEQMDINPKSHWYKPDFIQTNGGFFPSENKTERSICNLATWDTTRRDMLILLLRTVLEKEVRGDFVELGVYKGQTAKLIHYYAPEKKLHLFDTFEGFGERSVITEKQKSGFSTKKSFFSDTSKKQVEDYISPLNDNISFHPGYFPESIPKGFKKNKFAFVHLDADLYEPTFEGLKFFYPKMTSGGFIIIHDYNTWPGARKAVDEFFLDKSECPIPMPDKSGSAVIQKT